MSSVAIGPVAFSNRLPLALIAGPCQLESLDHAFMVAGSLKEICAKLGVGFVFKTSFDKANRTSGNSKRGLGLEKSLAVFDALRRDLNVPVLTDVHEAHQCKDVSLVVDALQIPALLSRQTDLLVAAARTGLPVNIKKGQFLAPWDMKAAAEKVVAAGNSKVLLTERGSSFGYNSLVVDMRSLAIMAETGHPVVFDATHAVQQPGGLGTSSGGDRRFVETLARSAVAVGLAGLFIETHEDPDRAPSDGPVMVRLNDMEGLLVRLMTIDRVAKDLPPTT